LEWALVHGNYYGTSKSFIESSLNSSKTVILDIDVQGAKIVKSKLPESKTIFIVPPSEEIWISRLKGRGTDSPESIEKRIANGKRELLEQDWFEYRIINDSIEESYQMLESIVCK
jgi:guanylate kinase